MRLARSMLFVPGSRWPMIEKAAASAGCRVVFVVAPSESMAPIPRVWSGAGGIDVFVPAIPKVPAGTSVLLDGYLDDCVMSRRGRRAFADQIALYVRKRILAGRGA